MNRSSKTRLLTPILHKIDGTTKPAGADPVCHVLAGNGLFIHRKHRFFTSCVRTKDWPAELATQEEYLELNCPGISQPAMEKIVGFFSRIAELHGSEAAAILYWDRRDDSIRFEIPKQRATVSESWSGGMYPLDVHYDVPQQTDADLSVFGSVHSHVHGAAYASSVDRTDETHRAGLHIVVGRIGQEPPELHCDYVVDGVRFQVDPRAVIEGYERRDVDVPEEWIERVEVETKSYVTKSPHYWGDGEGKSGRNGGWQ